MQIAGLACGLQSHAGYAGLAGRNIKRILHTHTLVARIRNIRGAASLGIKKIQHVSSCSHHLCHHVPKKKKKKPMLSRPIAVYKDPPLARSCLSPPGLLAEPSPWPPPLLHRSCEYAESQRRIYPIKLLESFLSFNLISVFVSLF